MDNRSEIREFLASRRAKVTPEQAGLGGLHSGHRRVPGLRREEVALLAGVSVEYYARLERGQLGGVSDSVLNAIADALQLNEAERQHLSDLARTAGASPRTARRRRTTEEVRPGILAILESLTESPAFVRNGRLDLLATNELGRAMFAPVFAEAARPANLARFNFLDPAAQTFYPDWNRSANTTVALLRTEAGRDPYNSKLTELIGELTTRSEEFSRRWAAHDVRLHHTGVKHFQHPEVGPLELRFEAMPLPADPGLTLTVYTAEQGSPTYDALRLLASWRATMEAAEESAG
ncbi:helix-turn-helix transcriptional regulator [Kribbella sp. NPDC050124]|uniref:helix-turn-helix transcriptional regulator n=1 Tax=Kribbella sp. NPDC050124 TaxID=3364114 RepID=UPI00378E4D3F